MKIKHLLVIGLGITMSALLGFSYYQSTRREFFVPKNWPKPVYDFAGNPLTDKGFELGRKLFYDPILSRDSTISCASCHFQATGFTHVDHQVSHGIEGKLGKRNALALQNLAWSKDLMWDGGVNHLDVQALNPITNPLEMDEQLPRLIHKLQQTNAYPNLFEKAFGSSVITGQHLLKALSQFVVQLSSANAKYDRVMRKETQFTEQEKKGYLLFLKNCNSCHQAPLFTSPKFEYNGLALDPYYLDYGRYTITGNPKDSLKFKVPSLRNCQFTAPYMHDGRFNTLTQVIQHYNQLAPNPLLPKELAKPMQLDDHERVDLVAFLQTLSDPDFLFNPKFGPPKS